MRFILLAISLFMMSFCLFAQTATITAPVDLDTLTTIVNLLKGLSGQKGLMLVVGIVQIIMYLISKYSPVSSKWKLILVTIMTLVGVIMNCLIQGMSWTQILFDAPTLMAIQVTVYEFIKLFKKQE